MNQRLINTHTKRNGVNLKTEACREARSTLGLQTELRLSPIVHDITDMTHNTKIFIAPLKLGCP